jgi:uncharacterized membrane protein
MNGRTDSLAVLETRLGRLFITGLTISASALAIGLVVYLLSPNSPAAILLLTAGLVILMATPLFRVLVSIVEYIRLGDWFFVTTTLVVLVELSVTMIYAFTRGE